ncbi:hypothetical protein TGAM01_v203596 [Trichoderma gamsii]|uniref:Short-chain dehydrogenase n=1 Tax=Trichoderma gamsii TaxID=398673 RepID=A0A2P4ZU82_9HYPO|nr:hypothetical protein TGAM01_v203596 [Trichoderma gamsii]PON27829.1 hypothetical protein TGAM01_v203596 [Trichoderma gamsii]
MHAKQSTFSENDIPNLQGYVIIVTGGNSGIGYETTLQLALRGARVYIANRSRERADEAIAQMRQSTNSSTIDVHHLKMDLLDLKSVQTAAQEFIKLEDRLDVLINNAGIMAAPYKLTIDGYETQWQTNYLSPHAFTVSLLPLLLSTAARCGSKSRVRVVNVSSDLAFIGPDSIQWDDVNMTGTKGMLELLKRYGHSKQAIIRDASFVNSCYSAQGVTAYSLHPGIVRSNLQHHDPSMFGTVMRVAMKIGPSDTPLRGALTSLYCATSPEAATLGAGKFFGPVAKQNPRADAWLRDSEGNKRLWELGESEMKSTGLAV